MWSILEMVVPVWTSGLTKQQGNDIKILQKVAFRIMLEDTYISYQLACKKFSALTLEELCGKLCAKFARTNVKSENCMFKKKIEFIFFFCFGKI